MIRQWTCVAHASLSEPKGDGERWFRRHGPLPWSIDSEEAQQIHALHLDTPDYDRDVVRGLRAHILAQRAECPRGLAAGEHGKQFRGWAGWPARRGTRLA
jgi:hypothetical protein